MTTISHIPREGTGFEFRSVHQILGLRAAMLALLSADTKLKELRQEGHSP